MEEELARIRREVGADPRMRSEGASRDIVQGFKSVPGRRMSHPYYWAAFAAYRR